MIWDIRYGLDLVSSRVVLRAAARTLICSLELGEFTLQLREAIFSGRIKSPAWEERERTVKVVRFKAARPGSGWCRKLPFTKLRA
jgi:hypothetical protein